MDNKRTILYLVTLAEHGGAQQYILDLALHFHARGNHIHIAAGENPQGYLFTEAKMKDIPTTYLTHTRRSVSPYHDIASLFEIYSLIKKIKPDIIHLNSSKIGFVGSLASRLAKVPKVVYTAHGFVFNEPGQWRPFYGRFIERFSSRFKDSIICVSDADHKSAISANIASAEKLITIPLGIDHTMMRLLTRREARKLIGVSGVIVGTIANLYPTKGLEYLVRAARSICASADNRAPKFVIIGEGPERSILDHFIRRFGLENHFLLLGTLASASRYLKAFDIFVLPSLKEGMPYTILEALTAGLPIVATRVGGIPEIIKHKKTGLLVKPRDEADLSAAIKKLLNNTKYAELLGRAGMASIGQWEITKMLEKTERVYGTLAKC